MSAAQNGAKRTAKTTKTIVQPTRAAIREQKPNFSAPLSTVARAHRAEPARESVEQFLRRGGRITKLKPGDSSEPLKHDHAKRDPPRRPAWLYVPTDDTQ